MGPNPRYGRNLHAVNAHFRRAGAFRDSRMSQLERVAELEIEEALDDGWARGDLDGADECEPLQATTWMALPHRVVPARV